jgi:hypothetical protein
VNPVERVARAMAEYHRGKENVLAGQGSWKTYLPLVSLVLDALHEPNDRMNAAGGQVIRHVEKCESAEAFEQDAANVWRLMIDAAKVDLNTLLT